MGWMVRHRVHMRIDIGEGKQPVTRCVFLIGMNPAQGVPPLWKSLRDGKKIGVKVIVADPRKTETAEMADLFLQLRPGTDTALLMSMIHVIIEEHLYDREFVEKWCYGFDKLVERAREYNPEKVAEISWVPADSIREAARMFANNRPSIVFHGMGTEHLSNSIEGIQARFILSAIVGSIDAEGGDIMPGPSKLTPCTDVALDSLLSPAQKQKQIGSDRFKLMSWPGWDLMQPYVRKVWGQECSIARIIAVGHAPSLYRAMITNKPYPVRGLITIASDPMITQGNVKLVYKALKSADLYVVHDYWLTPAAELADYVTPCASWMERPYIYDNRGEDSYVVAGQQGLPASIEGEYDHKTDYDFCRGLAMRLGIGEYWPWQNLEQVLDYIVKPMGLTFKEFMDKGGYEVPPNVYKKYEQRGFATPTGKAELYSTIFEKLGYDPLPRYEESHENPISTPELAKNYPLILINGGRFHPMFHSEHRQIESIRKRHPNPLVQIHPETAKSLGIENGDWVWIETPRGRIRQKCQYFDGMNPKVVHAEHGWWFPEMPGEEPWLHGVWESNVNVLTDDAPDVCNKLTGAWPLKTALCKVYKVKEYK